MRRSQLILSNFHDKQAIMLSDIIILKFFKRLRIRNVVAKQRQVSYFKVKVKECVNKGLYWDY